MDSIVRLSQNGDWGIDLKQQVQDKLIEHNPYIDKHGRDMPNIPNWSRKTVTTSVCQPVPRSNHVFVPRVARGLRDSWHLWAS